jgi:hypothetical protein
MIEPVKCPSTRAPSKGRRTIWLVVSLAFAALVFASGAQARGTNATTEAASGEAAESGAPPEQAEPTTGQTPLAAETAPPTVEQAPATAEEPAPVVEQAPPAATEAAPPATEQTPPAAETTPPAPETAPPPTEQAPSATGESAAVAEKAAPEAAPPATEATPPPTEQTPTVAEATPPTVEHVPSVPEAATPVEKEIVEQTSGGVGSEGLANQHTEGNSQASPAGSAPAAHDEVGEASPTATALITPGVPSEIPTVQDQPSFASPPRTIPAHLPEQASCESAAAGASFAVDGDGGWLSFAATASASTANFAAASDMPPTADTGGAPAGSQDDGSPVENHPSAPTPTPGPGPGGAGGGSAAGGGSGSASSASFTLVGSLLHAAPRATRRFRLAQQSWRTSFFVLVAERPD